MTISDLITQTRAQYNATNDTFFADSEIIHYYYEACAIFAREAYLIEATNTATTTVAGTQTYTVPTYAIIIKRLTYNGQKLEPIDFRQDDGITGMDQNTTNQGTPTFYSIFNRQVYLRPIPDAAQTLKYFTYNMPQPLTSGSTLEIPEQFHMALIPYALSRMYAKDKDFNAAGYYERLWNKEVLEAKKWSKKMRRGDAYAVVKSEEAMAETIIGHV